MRKMLLLLLLCSLCVMPSSWGAQGQDGDQNFTVTTMTRNMFPGADLSPIVMADPYSEDSLVAAAESIAEEVIESNIPGRAALIAAEIAANRPDLVALQEATKWKFKSTRGMIVLDQLELLMTALQKAGQHYRVAVVQKLTDVRINGLISYTDHDAILVRTDRPLNVVASETHIYDALLSFPFMDDVIEVLRGWIAVDVKLHGSRFKFVNTHLEAPLPGDFMELTQYIQFLQAQQLVAALSTSGTPVILAGDFNSDAEPTPGYPPDETPSYSFLVTPESYGGGGYLDPWHEFHSADDYGYTWPLFIMVDGIVVAVDPIERIDLILSKGPEAVSIERIGTSSIDGLFASDHAGVVAEFQLADPR